MKVAEVVTSVDQEASGPSYSVVQLCRALGEAGEAVTLFTLGETGIPPSAGFTHVAHPRAWLGGRLGRSPALAAALRDTASSSDLVHVHGMWLMPNVYPMTVAARGVATLVISPRGCLSPEALRRSRWKKRLFWRLFHARGFARASLLHATSEKEYEEIRAFGLTQPVAIIPNGIESPSTMPVRDVASRVVLFLGRVHPIKGIDLLLRAWKRALLPEASPWKLHIVGPEGEPGYVARLSEIVRSEGIPAVSFHPPAYGEEKWRRYRGAAIFVLPSRSENFGMTVLESLTAGTPVIATRSTPWPQLPEVGCGWYAELSEEGLETALRAAMSSPDTRLARMGEAGAAWVASTFSWPGIASRMAEAYRWAKNGGVPPMSVRVQ